MNAGKISNYIPYSDIESLIIKRNRDIMKLYGTKFVSDLAERIGNVIENILKEWKDYMVKKFESGQGTWRDLQEEYLDRKSELGYSTKKMQASGQMYESLSYHCEVRYNEILLILRFENMNLFRAGLNGAKGFGQVASFHYRNGFDLFNPEELLAIVNKHSKNMR
jgi:hypothetical protein